MKEDKGHRRTPTSRVANDKFRDNYDKIFDKRKVSEKRRGSDEETKD